MSSALSALHEVIKTDPRPYKNLVPSFTSILKQVRGGRGGLGCRVQFPPASTRVSVHRLPWTYPHTAPLSGFGAPPAQVVRLPPFPCAVHPGVENVWEGRGGWTGAACRCGGREGDVLTGCEPLITPSDQAAEGAVGTGCGRPRMQREHVRSHPTGGNTCAAQGGGEKISVASSLFHPPPPSPPPPLHHCRFRTTPDSASIPLRP